MSGRAGVAPYLTDSERGIQFWTRWSATQSLHPGDQVPGIPCLFWAALFFNTSTATIVSSNKMQWLREPGGYQAARAEFRCGGGNDKTVGVVFIWVHDSGAGLDRGIRSGGVREHYWYRNRSARRGGGGRESNYNQYDEGY